MRSIFWAGKVPVSDRISNALTSAHNALAAEGVKSEIKPIIEDGYPDLLIHGKRVTWAVDFDIGENSLHFGSVAQIQRAVEAIEGEVEGVILTNQEISGEVSKIIQELDLRAVMVTGESAKTPEGLASELVQRFLSAEAEQQGHD